MSVDFLEIEESFSAMMFDEVFGVGGNIFFVSLKEVDVGPHEFHHRMEQFITFRDLRKREGERKRD